MKSSIISMTKSSFLKEHKPLISILKSGSKKERLAEAKKQQKELNKYANRKPTKRKR